MLFHHLLYVPEDVCNRGWKVVSFVESKEEEKEYRRKFVHDVQNNKRNATFEKNKDKI